MQADLFTSILVMIAALVGLACAEFFHSLAKYYEVRAKALLADTSSRVGYNAEEVMALKV